MRSYICSECGQEMTKYKDQCPYCKVSDSLVENSYGHCEEELDGFIIPSYDETD